MPGTDCERVWVGGGWSRAQHRPRRLCACADSAREARGARSPRPPAPPPRFSDCRNGSRVSGQGVSDRGKGRERACVVVVVVGVVGVVVVVVVVCERAEAQDLVLQMDAVEDFPLFFSLMSLRTPPFLLLLLLCPSSSL
eukprot:3139981-Rhodomonas_salina.1